MKLKSLTFGTLAASTVIFASTVVAPAQAATVTGTLRVTESAGVNSITTNAVDFDNTPNFFAVRGNSTGTFAGLGGNGVTILQDLTAPLTSAFDFLQVENGVDDIFFNITGLAPFGPQASGDLFRYNVFGNFRLGTTNTPVKPSSFVLALDPSLDGSGFTNISISAAAAPVPTPALLPGLVGMGVAALRKRKSDGLESAELESAEA
jgi:hypothetical protein